MMTARKKVGVALLSIVGSVLVGGLCYSSILQFGLVVGLVSVAVLFALLGALILGAILVGPTE